VFYFLCVQLWQEEQPLEDRVDAIVARLSPSASHEEMLQAIDKIIGMSSHEELTKLIPSKALLWLQLRCLNIPCPPDSLSAFSQAAGALCRRFEELKPLKVEDSRDVDFWKTRMNATAGFAQRSYEMDLPEEATEEQGSLVRLNMNKCAQTQNVRSREQRQRSLCVLLNFAVFSISN
jgi:hypothetical protein